MSCAACSQQQNSRDERKCGLALIAKAENRSAPKWSWLRNNGWHKRTGDCKKKNKVVHVPVLFLLWCWQAAPAHPFPFVFLLQLWVITKPAMSQLCFVTEMLQRRRNVVFILLAISCSPCWFAINCNYSLRSAEVQRAALDVKASDPPPQTQIATTTTWPTEGILNQIYI